MRVNGSICRTFLLHLPVKPVFFILLCSFTYLGISFSILKTTFKQSSFFFFNVINILEILFYHLFGCSHDWDQELVNSILNLLVSMSNRSPELSLKIEKNGGSELCVNVMDNFCDSREIVINACMLLSNMGNAGKNNVIVKMGQQGVVDVLLSIVASQCGDATFVLEPIHTLSILTGDMNLAKNIASKGMHSICTIAKTHMSNPEILASVHKLIGFLAFQPECLRDIVQHDGPCMVSRVFGTQKKKENKRKENKIK